MLLLLTFQCRLTVHQYDHTGLFLPDKLFIHGNTFCIKALLGLTLTNNLGSCSSFSALMLWWCQGQSRIPRREAGLTVSQQEARLEHCIRQEWDARVKPQPCLREGRLRDLTLVAGCEALCWGVCKEPGWRRRS